MSDYSKTVNFTAKDSLTTGDPNKIVKGAEIDTELSNISTAVATKANKIAGAVLNDLVLQSSSGDMKAAGWGFPNVNADITATDEDINLLAGAQAAGLTAAELLYIATLTSDAQAQIDLLAPLASPTLTGTPAAPTPTIGDNDTSIATTAFVETRAVQNAKEFYTATGSTTVPAGVSKVRIALCGAGGGGGGGGDGGSGDGTNGTAGGNTTVTHGTSTLTANGGNAGNAGTSAGEGGASGTPTLTGAVISGTTYSHLKDDNKQQGAAGSLNTGGDGGGSFLGAGGNGDAVSATANAGYLGGGGAGGFGQDNAGAGGGGSGIHVEYYLTVVADDTISFTIGTGGTGGTPTAGEGTGGAGGDGYVLIEWLV